MKANKFFSSCQLLLWNRGAASQLGGRNEQQDRWGIFPAPDQQGLLTIVADGMGGHLDGALGAQLVIDTARTYLLTRPPPSTSSAKRMHDGHQRQSETARSTVVMVWLDHDGAHWLNIGDSRLYHFRRGRRLMRTRDHSAVQFLMDMGEIDESEMATHPAQNRLYRCFGGEEHPNPIQVNLLSSLAICWRCARMGFGNTLPNPNSGPTAGQQPRRRRPAAGRTGDTARRRDLPITPPGSAARGKPQMPAHSSWLRTDCRPACRTVHRGR
jgi:hypothetical protein